MDIDLQTKIGDLLDAYPDLEKVLVEISPVFAKLQNPALRRTVAKITTIQQAAKIGGIAPAIMIQTLRNAAGLSVEQIVEARDGERSEQRPDWLDEINVTVYFDASPVIEAGESPMATILRFAKELKIGETMELTAPFRPEPIMDTLRSRGFLVWYDSVIGKCYIKR